MGNLAVQNQGSNALAAYGGTNPWAEAGRGSEQGTYLQFNGNHGTLVYGSDDVDLPVTSLLVPDMTNYAQGWICWKDSAVAEEIFVPILDGKPPREAELDDHGPYDDPDDGWREAGSMPFVILEHGDDPATSQSHEDVGKSLLLKTSTGGAVRALKKLSASYGRLFMAKPGMFPIVEMKVESYTPKNKKFGIKYGIDFKIVDWIPEAELAAITGGFAESDDDYIEPEQQRQPEPEPEPEPAPRGRRAAAPQPAPEPEVVDEPEAEAEDLTPPADEPVQTGRRGRSAPAAEPEAAPAGRRGRTSAPAAEEPAGDDEGNTPLQPRGRSAGRGAPPTNARVRRF